MKFLTALLFTFLLSISLQGQILKKPIPDKLVVLTFDDAPASQYAIVAPLLKEYEFGATFFVCEFQPNYGDSTLYMNWRQIQALDQMGFEVANHTHTHANVSKLTQAEFNKQLAYIEAKCDSFGMPIPTNFAYPGYGLNPQTLELLEARGYVFARAGGSRAYDPLTDHPFLIPSWATDETNKAEILKAFDQAKEGKIVILTIHGVPDIEHPWVNTPPQLFEAYLQYLAANNFTVISVKDLEDYIDVTEADFNQKLNN